MSKLRNINASSFWRKVIYSNLDKKLLSTILVDIAELQTLKNRRQFANAKQLHYNLGNLFYYAEFT